MNEALRLSSLGRPPAVLIGGESIALSVGRSLGESGVPVYALGHETDPVRHSRHCTAFVEVGSGATGQQRSLDWLRHSGAKGAVILPCSDDGLELVARNRAELARLGYRPIEADDRVVLDMLNKARTYELADRIGVDRPRTITVAGTDDLDEATRQLAFPCALKPLRSHVFARHFGLEQKVLLAESPAELRTAVERTLSLGLEMLVTEIVPGPEDAYHTYYSYLEDGGRPLFEFTKRKLRQWPVGFGLPCYHVSDWNEEVAQTGLAFLRGVGVRGVASVEFKRDERDGRLKLIECNHRFSRSTEFLRLCGVDQAVIAYERAAGGEVPLIAPYRRGLHMWHPVEDVRAFRARHRRGELGFGEWVGSLAHRQHFLVLDWHDPKPSLAVNWRRARNAARKLAGRLQARARDPCLSPARAQPACSGLPTVCRGTSTLRRNVATSVLSCL